MLSCYCVYDSIAASVVVAFVFFCFCSECLVFYALCFASLADVWCCCCCFLANFKPDRSFDAHTLKFGSSQDLKLFVTDYKTSASFIFFSHQPASAKKWPSKRHNKDEEYAEYNTHRQPSPRTTSCCYIGSRLSCLSNYSSSVFSWDWHTEDQKILLHSHQLLPHYQH